MKSKFIYISNTRLPSEKANSYQTIQMCNSFSKVYDNVELWTGKSRNTKELDAVKDVYKFYNVKKTFEIKKFFQIDSKVLFKINEFLWANFRNLIFSLNICIHLIKFKNSKNITLYTREWFFIFVFLFFKKIGLVNNKLFYESHKFYKFLPKILAKIDGVIVINEYLYSLHKNFGIKNLFLAHDGVNIDEYGAISRYSFNPKKEIFKVVYTGSLFLWKGVNTLVNSLQFLPQNIELIIIGGSGQYLANFKKYVSESGFSDRIKVVPHVPKGKLFQFIEIADVLVLPNSAKDKMSLYTSPIKLFEYMASKRPIVASNIPSIAEVLSDQKNALFFKPDDHKDLAVQIYKTINGDYGEMVQQALKDSHKYTWDKRAKDISRVMKFQKKVMS
jgi:glycosyltransferase involved in cell wall biosynthesis